MSFESKVSVVIPVYKTKMTAYEKISFHRCLTVLGDYPLVLLAPTGLDVKEYVSFARREFKIYRFSPRFFKNTLWYSRLLLKQAFYKGFLDFEYILIYQLDAFVFSDRLLDWCGQGYDYIGAPWLGGKSTRPMLYKGMRFINPLLPFWNQEEKCFVGNGGFSLRNVRACISLLQSLPKHVKCWWGNEDSFFSYHGPRQQILRVPDTKTALKFAFEKYPEKCFSLNQEQLPFGCHAWEKWNITFWRPILQSFGYVIE